MNFLSFISHKTAIFKLANKKFHLIMSTFKTYDINRTKCSFYFDDAVQQCSLIFFPKQSYW